MNGYWKHPTRIGEALIIWKGRQFPAAPWRIEIDGEDLGGYKTPEQALDDLTVGSTFSHSRCIDTSTLELPDDFSDWVFVKTSN